MNKDTMFNIARPVLELFTSSCFGLAAFAMHKGRKLSENVRPKEDEMNDEKNYAYFQTDLNSVALEGLFAGATILIGTQTIVDTIKLFKK